MKESCHTDKKAHNEGIISLIMFFGSLEMKKSIQEVHKVQKYFRTKKSKQIIILIKFVRYTFVFQLDLLLKNLRQSVNEQ